MDAWLRAFRPADDAGRRIAPDEVPLVVALRDDRLVHARLTIVGQDGVRRAIETSCLPPSGQADSRLGAMAWLWTAP